MSDDRPLDDFNFNEDKSVAIDGNTSHDRSSFILAIALLFGRIAYFGICGILVLYATEEIRLTDTVAYPIYTKFLYAVLFF